MEDYLGRILSDKKGDASSISHQPSITDVPFLPTRFGISSAGQVLPDGEVKPQATFFSSTGRHNPARNPAIPGPGSYDHELK